jgi:putative Mn2+ efflux pump MntP
LNWLNLLGLSVGLAMDAFAVSIWAGIAIERTTPRAVFRLAFHFGLFQFMMPVIGWCAGSTVSAHVTAFGHWVAAILLSLVAARMLQEAWSRRDRTVRSNPTKGWMLVVLSIATSIDALAVGVGMAMLQVRILLPCLVIGLVAATFTAIGIVLANRVLRRWGQVAEVFGAGVLIVIAIRILLSEGA